MKTLFGTLTILGFFSAASIANANLKDCARSVIIVSPNRIQNQGDLADATHLLALPGLNIVHQTTYFGNGKMFLIDIQSAKVAKVIEALAAIEGVVVSCETYYDQNPRLTGTN